MNMALQTNSLRGLFGRILRRLRLAERASISEVANRAGISIGYLSMIERGVANPTMDVCEMLLAHYHVEATMDGNMLPEVLYTISNNDYAEGEQAERGWLLQVLDPQHVVIINDRGTLLIRQMYALFFPKYMRRERSSIPIFLEKNRLTP
mgnify:CR=1 FL=1